MFGGCSGESPTLPGGPPRSITPSTTVPDPPTEAPATGRISVTDDDRILVELLSDDTTGNPFDLNGKTLIFTPDGSGGYSRSISPVLWETDVGDEVSVLAPVAFRDFQFEFAGQRWGSFHISPRGVLTFGSRHIDRYMATKRYSTMRELAAPLSNQPTISVLYKPLIGWHDAGPFVSYRSDSVVVTWPVADPAFDVDGAPPAAPSRFQAVLGADGSIRFNYLDIAFGDGVVGLFPATAPAKGDLITSLSDTRDPALPGHLDILEVAVYETDANDRAIVEFTVRDTIPEPDADIAITYDLLFDTDEPYWTHWEREEQDFNLSIRLENDGVRTKGGALLRREAQNRIALLADIGFSASIMASATQYEDSVWVAGDSTTPREITVPEATADLSQPDDAFAARPREVFRYRSAPDLASVACRIVAELGDAFDLFVFHSEFRIDVQESLSAWRGYRNDDRMRGTGLIRSDTAPCGRGRLKGHWRMPHWIRGGSVWSKRRADSEVSADGFDVARYHFAHEFGHSWLAFAGYEKNGMHRKLDRDGHWLREFHAPTAFPWRENLRCRRSLMGGWYWVENRDGSFTRDNCYGASARGFSWLDLYLMGLADADEVPDTFIVRNLRKVGELQYSGEKEIVSIEQVIAAEGPREPTPATSQKDFNAGFVYLLDQGQRPASDLLERHARFRDAVLEHWEHITGGRSRMRAEVATGSRAAATRR